MEMENKRREMAEEELFRGPTTKQWREYERRLEAENKRWDDGINEREDRKNDSLQQLLILSKWLRKKHLRNED